MKRTNLFFLTILLLGLALRLYKLNIPLLEFEPSRQIQTADITRNFIKNDFNFLNPTISYLGSGYKPFLIEFPGYNFVVATLYLVFGINEISGRLFSLLGWVISFVLLYKISEKIIGSKFSLMAILFYALSPMSILVSRSFQPDQWMITLSLAAIYFALAWSERKKLRLLLLSLIFASLAALVKVPSIFFTVIPIIFLILYQRINRKVFHIFSYAGVLLLPSVMWYLYAFFANKSGGLTSQGAFSFSTWFWPALFLDYKYYATVFGWNYNQVILPVGLILFAVGLFTGGRKMRFLYIWIASIVVYFFAFNRHTMVHEYYNLPFLPVASIFIAIGTMRVAKNFKNNSFVYLFILFMVFISALPQIFTKAYQPIDRFKFVSETGREVTRITKPGDLIIGAMDSGPTVVYYSNRNGWGFDITGTNNPPVNGKALSSQEYLEYLRTRGAVVFASADKQRLLNNPSFYNYMDSKYKILVDNQGYVIFDLASQNQPQR